MARSLRKILEDFVRFRVKAAPGDTADLPITPEKDSIGYQLQYGDIYRLGQFDQFRQFATDRQSLYNAYDEMRTDSIIAAALEIYADDATQYDEQGRVVWVESENETIAKAANRLLDILEIPERAWKHIYQACLYGDCYLKLYRDDEDFTDKDKKQDLNSNSRGQVVKVVNDKVDYKGYTEVCPYLEYVEDVPDPACLFDLRYRGKTAGFIEVTRDVFNEGTSLNLAGQSFTFQLKDVDIYKSDRFVHIALSEAMSRTPEEVTLDFGDDKKVTYQSYRGKSILQDVYPIQKELTLLEDALLLNRLTRSPLIRLLEIEVGDMPKKEVNDYLRRIKNLIEQHIAFDKDKGGQGYYKSYQSPGPIDNVIYIPTRGGKGSVNINNLGGDVNIRDIADIDYFNNKRAGALKIPRAMLGDDMTGSGLDSGGSLTRLSIRYARTIKRIQTAYIRAITTLLNLFFVDKKLDYVNKFTVRMTSPSTQEDLERNELIANNVDIISSIMDLTESLEGNTQKKILNKLVRDVLKMPEIAEMIEEDMTPSEEIDIGAGTPIGGSGSDINIGAGTPEDMMDISSEFGAAEEAPEGGETEGGFTASDYEEFTD